MGPGGQFKEILERTHGGLIVEQYRTALLNLVPDVRLIFEIDQQPDDKIHKITLGLCNQLPQIHAP